MKSRLLAFALFAAFPAAHAQDIDSLRAVIRDMLFPLPDLPPVPATVAGTDTPKISLNGKWEIGTEGKTTTPPGAIDVPGEWEMQGYDFPHETAAIYRRVFVIPAGWSGLNVYVRFDGVSSYCSVLVNGMNVGSHEGSFVPFAFDISTAMKTGTNVIEAAVNWGTISDSLACTSQYAAHPVAGILRKVTLYSLPRTHIAGCFWNSTFGPGYRDAFLDITCSVAGGDASEQAELSFTLTDADGTRILRTTHGTGSSPRTGGRRTCLSRLTVRSPHKWDPEHPYLYTLTTTLSVGGRPLQSNTDRIGFREIEIRGNRLFVNNRPTKLRGINHHEVHPIRGRSLTPALCRLDVELFRAANCNYIRTSHYPPSEELLEACDELGMFVESEASLCWIAHGAAPIWSARSYTDTAILPHMVRANLENVLAGRRHPSVIIWSLGNESRWSPLWERVNAEVKKLDPTRPTSFHDQSWGSYNNAGSRADIAVYHYPGFDGPATCEKTTDRPTLFGEYMHVQTYARRENEADPGVRSDSWARTLKWMVDSVYAHPACLGGAVWSGIDDVFHLSDSRICGYGTWGPLDGWRRKKPEYTGIRKSYSPVGVRCPAAGGAPGGIIRIPVENRYNTTNLSELAIRARSGGREITLKADAAPFGMGEIDIDASALPGNDPIMLSFRDPRGFICDEELIARKEEPPASPAEGGPPVTLAEESGTFVVRSGDITFRVSKRDGVIASILKGSDTVVTRGGEFMLIPHNTDDGGAPGTSGNNYTQDLQPLEYDPPADFSATSVTASANGGTRMEIRGTFGGRIEGTLTMRFHPGGILTIGYDYVTLVDFTASGRSLLRQYGILFTLPGGFNRLRWKRTGLWTVYPEDDPGRLEGTARANPRKSRFVEEPRLVPAWQWKENANGLGTNDFRGTKEHIRGASLTDDGGDEFDVTSDGSQSARAWIHGDNVRLLVAGLNAPGSCTFFTGPRPEFPAGSHLKGEFTIAVR